MNAKRFQPSRLPLRRGFTLIEVLVALGIFSILLTIIMVPLNMGVNMTRIGSARTDTQQAAQATMNRIVTELRGASFVFPNAPMVGITDKAPYTGSGTLTEPYFRDLNGTGNPCDTNTVRFSNTGRLDFLTPATANTSAPNPEENNSIVSFYAARADATKAWEAEGSYSADLNSVVLYRAQIPFKRLDGADFLNSSTSQPNAVLEHNADAAAGCSTTNAPRFNAGNRWMMHNGAGEPLMALQTNPAPGASPPNPALQENPGTGAANTDTASNVRITPLGVGLYAPQADNTPVTGSTAADLNANLKSGRMFTPATSFICEDTNQNGIIDRVTVTLVMGKYDGAGAQNRAQSVRLVQTVDLPNVESRFSNTR